MTKITAIVNKISTENKEITIKIIGNFVPWSYGHRDKFGAPEEPDETAHFDIIETSIDGLNYDDEGLAEMLGISVDSVVLMIDEALGNAYEEHIEACNEYESAIRLDVFRDIEDY